MTSGSQEIQWRGSREAIKNCHHSRMPTPVGHAMAGVATAWLIDAATGRRTRRFDALTKICLATAVLPDVDILFRSHRTYAHSIGAAVLAGVVAMVVANARPEWFKERRQPPRDLSAVAIGCAAAVAYASHILLDWLARDTAPPFGLMALWPFSSRFYLSHADIFLEVSRRYWKPSEFIVGNLIAALREIVVLGPVVALSFLASRQRR